MKAISMSDREFLQGELYINFWSWSCALRWYLYFLLLANVGVVIWYSSI